MFHCTNGASAAPSAQTNEASKYTLAPRARQAFAVSLNSGERRSSLQAPPGRPGCASIAEAVPDIAVAPRTRQAPAAASVLFAGLLHAPGFLRMKENGPCALFDPGHFGAMLSQCFEGMQPGERRHLVLLTGTHSIGLELCIDAGAREPASPPAFVVAPWSLHDEPIGYAGCTVDAATRLQDLRMADVFGSAGAAEMTGGVDAPLGRVYDWPPAPAGEARAPLALHVSPDRLGTPAFLYAAMDAGRAELVRGAIAALRRREHGRGQEVLEAALLARRAGHAGPPALHAAARTQANTHPGVLETYAREVMSLQPDEMDAQGKLRMLSAKVNHQSVVDKLIERGEHAAAARLLLGVLESAAAPRDRIWVMEQLGVHPRQLSALALAQCGSSDEAAELGGRIDRALAAIANGAAAPGDRLRSTPPARAGSH